MKRRVIAAVVLVLIISLLPFNSYASSPTIWQPTATNPIHWQWEIGSTFNTATDFISGVTVYDIDLFENTGNTDNVSDIVTTTVAAIHAKGDIAIAYIDFGTAENWRPDYSEFKASDLGDSNGWPGEQWLNISDLANIEPIMENRIQLAKAAGFNAIEPDNIDGCENTTGFPLTLSEQLTYDEWIASAVHAAGMSVGLKNFVDQAVTLEPYFDWDLDEQAYQYQEWSPGLTDFVSNNKAVFEAEYTDYTGDAIPQANTMNTAHINSTTYDLDLVGPTQLGYYRNPCIADDVNIWPNEITTTTTTTQVPVTTSTTTTQVPITTSTTKYEYIIPVVITTSK